MKKSLLFIIAVLVIHFSRAQSSLDSLRMVLPEITKIDFTGYSKTGKYIWIEDGASVFVLDSRSKKVIRSFHREGFIGNVDFNYNDQLILISFGWIYETDIYRLDTGELVKRVELGYHEVFSAFYAGSNAFAYCISDSYEGFRKVVFEDVYLKNKVDSLIINSTEFQFDGTIVKYLDSGVARFYDVRSRKYIDSPHDIDLNSNETKEHSLEIENVNLLGIEKPNLSPFSYTEHIESDNGKLVVSNNTFSGDVFSTSKEVQVQSDTLNYSFLRGLKRAHEERAIIGSKHLRIYRPFEPTGEIDSIDLEIPLEFSFDYMGSTYEFYSIEAESICSNGDFSALSFYHPENKFSVVFVLNISSDHEINIESFLFDNQYVDQLYFIEDDGSSFTYRSRVVFTNDDSEDILKFGIYHIKTKEHILSSSISESYMDSLLGGNSDFDVRLIDHSTLLFFSKQYSQSSLEYSFFTKYSMSSNKFEKLSLKTPSVITNISLVSNRKLLWALDRQNSISLFSLDKSTSLFSIQLLANNNYLIRLPNSPYYMCSKDASKRLHYVTPSLKVIGFDQLDPVYNRPDVVLDSIGKYFGGADEELVASYRLAWEKRVEKLGLKKELLATGEIAVPNAEIVNAEQIDDENKDGKVILHIKANDPKYTLQRYNVLVNEVPVYGSAGISIAGLNTKTWERTDTITLGKGRNKIQVSVMNELGLENFKYPTYVNYMPKPDVASKTVFIGIGVNHFKESVRDLKYCVKDVQDLANEFASNQSLVDTLLLTDQEVTRENVLALRAYLLKNTTENDKVIISCSSHGLLDDSLNFFLAMHDVDFKNPKGRGLKYEELESLLDGIPARQKLLLLDACNSGENDKTELLKRELSSMEQASTPNAELTAQIGTKKGVLMEIEEENQTNFRKMNELFVNVRNNTGSVIISAAGGQQSALEAIEVDGQIIENGAFTFSVLEYLKQREGDKIKVTELKQYAEKRVEEITEGKQKPTSRQETMEVDFFIWE